MVNHIRNRVRHVLSVAALSLVLALAILAALAPQTAQAAVTCRSFYVFREGDTKPYIAHTYDLSWKEIAKANNMNSSDKVKVGDRLCIPEGEAADLVTPAGSSKAKIRVSIVGGNTIRISVDDFSQRHSYLVKVRSSSAGIGDWTKLGRIQVVKNDAQNYTFSIPNDLRDAAILNVCLKDMTTDELICRNAGNP